MGAPGSGRPATRTIVFAEDRPIYERQPNESDKAWAAFLAYRECGSERTLPKAVERLNKHPRYIGVVNEWSQKFAWRRRIEEYERSIDVDARLKRVDEAAVVHKEMISVAVAMWKLAAKDLMRWHKKIDKHKEDAPALNPRDLHLLADAGMKLHRLFMGEPDSIVENRHELSVDEERKTLRALLMDKEALSAIDLINEKMDGAARGNGSGNGSGAGLH